MSSAEAVSPYGSMSMTSEASSFSVAGPSSTGSSRNGLRPFQGHHDAISAVCYSPDGRKIATGGDDRCIRVWDSNTGETLIEIDYSGSVISLCYSPDGKRLVSGGWHGGIHMWSASNGELITECVKAHSSSSTIAYSPDGQHIATGGSDGWVRIWRAKDMAEMMALPEHPNTVTSVSFSPDGCRLATGCWDSRIRIFDIVTGALVMPPLEGHTEAVRMVVYSPNGTQLASCSDDCTIRVWDALTGTMLLGPLEGHFDVVCCVAYPPDGKRLVSGSDDKTIRLWEAETGKPIGGPVRGHDDEVFAISFAPDGTRFITGSRGGSIRVWDARTQEIISPELTKDEREQYQLTGPFRGHTGEITVVAYFPDGNRIATASYDGTIRIWDVHTGEQLGRLIVRECSLIALSSDGSKLVSRGDDVRIWDIRSGRLVLGPLAGYASCVQFSPDNNFIASSHWGNICLWNSQTGKQLHSVKGHDGWIRTLSFSADGRRLASGGDDERVCVWDVLTMEIVAGPFKGHTRRINSVAFSPDSLRIASGSRDATVRVWDAKMGSLLLGPLDAHSRGVTSVSYAPDGTRICSTSKDGTVCLWLSTTGDLVLGPLQGHMGEIQSAFSPDGKHIVTASRHGIIKFWDVATGEIMHFPKRAPGSSIMHVHARSKPLLELLVRPLDLTDSIRRLDDFYCAVGGFGDIYKCLYDSPSGTFEVAVKALRFSMELGTEVDRSETDMVSKPVHRELGIWRRLSHENIVPFLGIASGFGLYTSLVSMWMPNGTLQSYLKSYDDRLSIIDRFRLLGDVISGLEYLHSRSVVHGDLTPSNILIDDDFRARLTDFGFSSAIGNLPNCLAYLQRSTLRPGATRWAAPEKLLQTSHSTSQLTTKSDIYSFGCIMLQVLSGKQPWSESNDMMIPVYLFNGTNPPRPSSHSIDDQHWALIEECFLPVDQRPSTEHVAVCITSILNSLSSLVGGTAAVQHNTLSERLMSVSEQAGLRLIEGLASEISGMSIQNAAGSKRSIGYSDSDERRKRPKFEAAMTANFAGPSH